MPVMIYAAPQLNTGVGGVANGILGVGSLNGVNGGLGPVSNTVAGGGVVAVAEGAVAAVTGVTRGGLLGRSQNAAEKLEDLGGSDRT